MKKGFFSSNAKKKQEYEEDDSDEDSDEMKAIEEKLLQEDQDKMTMNVEEMNEDDLELLLEDSMDEESDDDAKAEEVQKLLKDAEIEKQNKGIGGLLNALPVSESMSSLTGSSKAQDETMASNEGGEKRDDVQKKSFFKDLAFFERRRNLKGPKKIRLQKMKQIVKQSKILLGLKLQEKK